MKTRIFSFLSLATAYILLTSGAALVGGSGCSSSGSGGSSGTGGSGPGDPANRISDFEDIAAATVTADGTPARNGYWYTYNDDNPSPATDPTCIQNPISGPQATGMNVPNPKYIGTSPPTTYPGATGSLALHAVWSGCGVWGAGVGADLNQPMQADGGTYTGPKVAYDVTAYKGVTFWAMATMGTDTALRMKFPMTDETKTTDGGICVDSATNKCADDPGEQINLPSNGTWKQFTIKWADTSFKQEGWGAVFPWNPMHVTSVQIQSVDKTEGYDFWIDDLYFIP
jgi:hypothetical protein